MRVTHLCSNRSVTEPPDQYLHSAGFDLELGGATFKVELHLGLVRGRTVCVGLSLRAFEESTTAEGPGDLSRQAWDPWAELTARRLRQVRLEELTDAVRDDMLRWLDDQSGLAISEDVRAWLTRTRTLYDRPARQSRAGRPAHLPDDLVETLVAGAYERHVRAGGSSPVVAVQSELQRALDAGELADTKFVGGAAGEVTIHQARALVRRARTLGLLTSSRRGEKG